MTINKKKGFFVGLILILLTSSCSYSKKIDGLDNQPAPPTSSIVPSLSITPSLKLTEVPGDTLQSMTDYLVYINKIKESDQWGVFALHPGESNELLLARETGGLNFKGCSPDGSYCLLDGDSIYLSNSDGSNYHQLYSDQQYKGINSFWISNSQIVVNAYKELGLVPERFILNIEDGHIQFLDQTGAKVVLNSFPFIGIAIEKDYSTNEFFKLDITGKEEKIFEGFEDIVDLVGFSQGTQEYIIIANKHGDNVKRLWAVTADTYIKREIYDLRDYKISNIQLSPDNKYMAFTAFSPLYGEDACISFINLQSGKMDHQWRYPYWPNNATFVWSPDSRKIALPYTNGTPEKSGSISNGIQVMDISTGKTDVILEKNVIALRAWIRFEK